MIPFVVEDFIWPASIAEKVIIKHGLVPDAVEEAFFDPAAQIRRTKDGRLFSRTSGGQYIIVVLAYSRRIATMPK